MLPHHIMQALESNQLSMLAVREQVPLQLPLVLEALATAHLRTLHQAKSVLDLHVLNDVCLELGGEGARLTTAVLALVVESAL